MKEEAEKYKVQDEERIKGSKAKNNLENYVYSIKGILRVCGNKMGIKSKRRMGDIVDQIMQWLEWNYLRSEATKFEEKMDEFEGICEPIIEKMQQQQYDDGCLLIVILEWKVKTAVLPLCIDTRPVTYVLVDADVHEKLCCKYAKLCQLPLNALSCSHPGMTWLCV
ncbi:hypothetical protein Cgig2_004778 [Carnegiea gigantea]|uniref:Uncharacterized protein n=1 Tax=Carnegiea gigantea TaxID=171969 RepID=A0A9Q1KWW7_9CARY|nr:hypothetical protein Cgig2_004778 [Carnegiea gigantea]